MSDKEILEKAIQKAIEGGWNAKYSDNKKWITIYKPFKEVSSMHHYKTWGSYDIIFNHDFAKALWGEYVEPVTEIESYNHWLENQLFDNISIEEYNSLSDEDKEGVDWNYYTPKYKIVVPANEGWQYHLMKMVVEKEPLKYLGENI